MKLRKILCCVFATILMGSLTACDGGGFGGGGKGGGSGTINILYVMGGFDGDQMDRISADYKAKTGITVKWNGDPNQGTIQQLLTSRQEVNDIVMPLLNIYQAQDANLLESLNDVYDAIPEGADKPIKERMNQSLYEYFGAADGNIYQMPGQNSVSALCYNADTLDEAFGAGNWKLPRTTNELKTMCDQLKMKGYYGFSTSAGINYYWDYLGLVWWAQYDGMENFSHYYYCEVKNESTGEWEVSQEINDLPGRRIALDALGTFMSTRNGYMHKNAKAMSFTQAQRAFLGGGHDDDKKKVAFMVNGDWLEQEMTAWLLANPQNIGMMRTPVISNLAGKLATVSGESDLIKIIDAVDAGATSAAEVTGVAVSESDFEQVRTARLMAYTATPNYPIAIPSYRPENKKKMAKDFLVYLYSDAAQRIMAQELHGLCYPSGYDVLGDESVQVSNFVRTRIENFGNDMVAVFPHNVSPAMYRGGLSDLPSLGHPDQSLFEGMSATTMLSKCATDLAANWTNITKALSTSGTQS
ncbi:MAG: extracellular solute-binding protein [Clostridiales bacterium]|nr:extracellular solute-binding protein [Clostridiales bacterium]